MAKAYGVAVGAFLATILLTWCAMRIAVDHGLVDHPNARSSHHRPTPRGGGVAIAAASSIAVLILYSLGYAGSQLTMAIVFGGLMVAWIGFNDDRRGVSVRWRLAVHAIAAIWAVYVLGGLPPLQLGSHRVDFGWAGDVLATIGIVWALNLFNFMDGIDGIAASEAVFVMTSGALLVAIRVPMSSISIVALTVACASAGFLLWNWPPAKIFMGDVGSGYLGYVMGVLTLASTRDNEVMPFVWLILAGVFFADATLTLVRRLIRGDRIFEAHRSHAYQWLARRWKSHRRVTLVTWGINLLWLLPMAWMCNRFPERAIIVALAALLPLIFLALIAGAGRAESAGR